MLLNRVQHQFRLQNPRMVSGCESSTERSTKMHQAQQVDHTELFSDLDLMRNIVSNQTQRNFPLRGDVDSRSADVEGAYQRNIGEFG